MLINNSFSYLRIDIISYFDKIVNRDIKGYNKAKGTGIIESV